MTKKVFIYTERNYSNKRKFNMTVFVYQICDNKEPVLIGFNDKINTGSWKGGYAIACQIIANETGEMMDDAGYWLKDSSIKVIGIL